MGCMLFPVCVDPAENVRSTKWEVRKGVNRVWERQGPV